MKRLHLTTALVLLVGLGACSADDPGPCPTDAGTICTYMGTGRAGLGSDGVLPEEVQLYLPQDLSFDLDGVPYVLDWNNHRVRTLDEAGRVTTVVGTGQLGDAPDGDATAASLNHPTHVSFDPTGMLILSAWHNSKVARIDLAKNSFKTICGTGARAFGGDKGPAHDAVLDLPVATVFDSLGRMIISDEGNQRLRRVATDGTIDTIVGPDKSWLAEGYVWRCETEGQDYDTCKACKAEEASDPDCKDVPVGKRPRPQGFAGDGGPATAAMIYLPFSQSAPPSGRIAIDAEDTLYLADTGNHRVRSIDKDGIIRTIAGSGPDTYDPSYAGGYGGDGGPATAAKLKRPTDVAVAPDGTLFIADTHNSCVRRVSTDGVITTLAGQCGQRGYAGDGGAAAAAKLDRPYGIALNATGDLYIADTHNHRIRVVYGAAAAE